MCVCVYPFGLLYTHTHTSRYYLRLQCAYKIILYSVVTRYRSQTRLNGENVFLPSVVEFSTYTHTHTHTHIHYKPVVVPAIWEIRNGNPERISGNRTVLRAGVEKRKTFRITPRTKHNNRLIASEPNIPLRARVGCVRLRADILIIVGRNDANDDV